MMFWPTATLDTSQVQTACASSHHSLWQTVAWLGWHALYGLAALLVLILVSMALAGIIRDLTD